jgi:hypothetical protein
VATREAERGQDTLAKDLDEQVRRAEDRGANASGRAERLRAPVVEVYFRNVFLKDVRDLHGERGVRRAELEDVVWLLNGVGRERGPPLPEVRDHAEYDCMREALLVSYLLIERKRQGGRTVDDVLGVEDGFVDDLRAPHELCAVLVRK